MAANATIHKVELSVSDMDRHYYATHALTLAQHPSETETRLMLRLLAFALYADERLAFGRGVSDEDEPALWKRDFADGIELWIELGQPDEARVRKACNRARQVVVLGYGDRAAEAWWDRVGNALSRQERLTVLHIDDADAAVLAASCRRSMHVQCLLQDGELQWIDGDDTLAIRPGLRHGAYQPA